MIYCCCVRCPADVKNTNIGGETGISLKRQALRNVGRESYNAIGTRKEKGECNMHVNSKDLCYKYV